MTNPRGRTSAFSYTWMADKRAVVTGADLRKLSLIVSTLRGAGAVVFPATAAEAARRICEHLRRIDILIVHTAPDAVELAEELHTAHPDLVCLHIAGLIDASAEVGRLATSPGLLLREPFSPNVLLRAVAGMIVPPHGVARRPQGPGMGSTPLPRLTGSSSGADHGWASPDNIAVSERSLMVQEDPAYTGFTRPERIWNFPLKQSGGLGNPRAVVELRTERLSGTACSEPDGTCWESSGIIDGSRYLGDGSWLFDVQAHTLPFSFQDRDRKVDVAREGGQLLHLHVDGS